ncbi:sulfotransferase [Thalassotalea maritima]|uniref:sulfotransferase n=1 Tax=Thalassotalea maritima TaxID=3242416 RepID=UPI003528ABAF
MTAIEANQGKIFIIGLPRTATTSVCVAMLNLGYQVAHTCYTSRCLTNAEVIADTPVFSEYAHLDAMYPNSRFIYLERELSLWVPSIKQLLARMATNVLRQDGGLNTFIKHSFTKVFSPFTEENIADDTFLSDCYQRHQADVLAYFAQRPHDLLRLDVSDDDAYSKLLSFLGKAAPQDGNFARINVAGKVIAWNKVRHSGKIESTENGRIDKHLFTKLVTEN